MAPVASSSRPRRTWPWNPAYTPTTELLNSEHPGKGTSESPFAVDWVPSVAGDGAGAGMRVRDPEYPQNWSAGRKWGIVAIGALSVLSVTMTSSMMSAAIFDIRRAFPGHTDEMYIMGEW